MDRNDWYFVFWTARRYVRICCVVAALFASAAFIVALVTHWIGVPFESTGTAVCYTALFIFALCSLLCFLACMALEDIVSEFSPDHAPEQESVS